MPKKRLVRSRKMDGLGRSTGWKKGFLEERLKRRGGGSTRKAECEQKARRRVEVLALNKAISRAKTEVQERTEDRGGQTERGEKLEAGKDQLREHKFITSITRITRARGKPTRRQELQSVPLGGG